MSDVGSTTTGANDPPEQSGVWREVGPNEVLPPGCHVRMNMTTGRSEVLAPAQDTADTTSGDVNERESGPAETVQATVAAPMNDAPKAPDTQPSRQRGKRAKAATAQGRSNGAAGAHVDPAERKATIAHLVATEDDAEYDAQVTQEAKRIGVKVRTINQRRAAYKKANTHQVDAADVQAAIARMLELPPAVYAIQLKREAQGLGIPTAEFKKLVEAEREKLRTEAEAKKRAAAGFGLSGQPPPGATPRREPDADGAIFPQGVYIDKGWLWYQPPAGRNGEDPNPVRFARIIRVLASAADEASSNFGLLLGWTDSHGNDHRWAMPLELVHADGNAIAGELQRNGLRCAATPKGHEALKYFLSEVRSVHRARSVDSAGWHDNDYVLPDGRVFGSSSPERLVMQSEHIAPPNAYITRGSLDEWKTNIAKYAVGNDLLTFAISFAFAGTLLRFTGDGSGGFHIVGGSQTGKTTALCVGASVWGPGVSKGGQICQWRATANGLEAVAAQHSDRGVFLDELGQASAREVGDIVYTIANGQGKARMSRAGVARQRLTWRTLWLSTGEVTLAAKMGEAGQRALAGQEARQLTIAADAGAGYGVYAKLHGFGSGAALTDELRRNAEACCGTAGPVFLEKITADCARPEDLAKLTSGLRTAIDAFLREHMPEGADGQVVSAAKRFALVGAAGELARSYDILPWDEGLAMHAAAACFRSWLAGRGGEGAAEDRQAIEDVKLFIALHGNSRFENLDEKEREVHRRDQEEVGESKPPFEPRIINRAGYVRTVGDGKEFLFLVPVWRNEVFKGMDAGRAAKAIFAAGFLLPGNQNMSTVAHIPGTGSVRVYVVNSAILG
jgi:uncharacterized protein (DUF927 family)